MVACFRSLVVFSGCNFGCYFLFRKCVFNAFFYFLPFSYFTRLGFIQNGTERGVRRIPWNGTERRGKSDPFHGLMERVPSARIALIYFSPRAFFVIFFLKERSNVPFLCWMEMF